MEPFNVSAVRYPLAIASALPAGEVCDMLLRSELEFVAAKMTLQTQSGSPAMLSEWLKKPLLAHLMLVTSENPETLEAAVDQLPANVKAGDSTLLSAALVNPFTPRSPKVRQLTAQLPAQWLLEEMVRAYLSVGAFRFDKNEHADLVAAVEENAAAFVTYISQAATRLASHGSLNPLEDRPQIFSATLQRAVNTAVADAADEPNILDHLSVSANSDLVVTAKNALKTPRRLATASQVADVSALLRELDAIEQEKPLNPHDYLAMNYLAAGYTDLEYNFLNGDFATAYERTPGPFMRKLLTDTPFNETWVEYEAAHVELGLMAWEVLGENIPQWTLLLELLPHWPGTIPELLTTVQGTIA